MLTLPLTSRLLRDFRKCPLLFHRKQSGLLPQSEPKTYLIENATRCLILQGREEFDRRYLIGGDRPINPRTGAPFGTETKAYAEWRATVERDILTEEEGLLVINMAAAVATHDEANRLLHKDGVAFNRVDADFHGIPATAVIHWLSCDAEIVEVCIINDLDRFEQQAKDGDYAHRLEFQERLAFGRNSNSRGCYFIAVERKEPYRVGVWETSGHTMAEAYGDNRDAAETIKDCDHSGEWPTRYEKLKTLEIRNGDS